MAAASDSEVKGGAFGANKSGLDMGVAQWGDYECGFGSGGGVEAGITDVGVKNIGVGNVGWGIDYVG